MTVPSPTSTTSLDKTSPASTTPVSASGASTRNGSTTDASTRLDGAARDAGPSIGQLAADASTHLSTIIRGEVELAKTELKVSVKNAGVGVVLFLVAAVLGIYGLTFGLIALAEGLVSLGLWRWAAFLVVFAILIALAAIFAFIGLKKVKKIKAPERTITTSKDTVAFLKHPTQA